jgi:DNA-binding NtrC family response regulator
VAHVLVVDDDAASREAVHLALGAAGHVVSDASDVPAALATLRASPHAQVVLVDVTPPGQQGLQLLRSAVDDVDLAMRHGYVVLTGVPLAQLGAAAEMLRALAIPILLKPVNPGQILAVVTRVAQQIETNGWLA